MHFDSLSGLWFGLSLPAIVLMYLFKRKYIDTPVSSHMLWNRVLKDMEANRPWQKLRNRLLMLVQLLAAALLVLSIMQPWVWANRSAKAHVVVVLDRSASMTANISAAEGEPLSRLERAKREIGDWARGEGKNSAITLVTMGGQADVLLSRETDSAKLLETLSQIQPDYGKTSYKEAMSLAAALTRNDPESEVRLFTDGQFAESVAGLAFAVPVSVHRTAGSETKADGNVSIAQFGVKTDRQASGGSAVTAVATVKNWGETVREVDAALYAGAALSEVKTIRVEPGKTVSVYFEHAANADWYKLDIGTDDTLLADNVMYAFPEGERPRNVLLVGEGNLFLEKALQLAGAEVAKLAPDGVEAFMRSMKPDREPDLIAVDSVADGALTSELWRKWMATRPVLFIRSGYAGEETPVPAGPLTIEEHPVTRYLQLQDTHVASALRPTGLTWGKPVVSAKDVPLLYAGSENGQPRLLVAFSLQQSDFPLRTEFPVFVQNALAWLTAANGGSLGRAIAGEHKEIAMSAGSASAEWVSVHGESAAMKAEMQEGRLSAVQTIPVVPGLYRLEEKDEGSRVVQSRWLAVTADSRESGNAAAELDFKQAVGEQSAGMNAGQDDGQAQSVPINDTNAAHYELWRWLVLLVLAVVIWEWGVYRRGTAG
ncbi:vWA domain-containing protein [Paenibacillus ginsengarvi]|uniref:vWA domain-containing protein n=1 Tax=Paenibacillus ginsengarvi TaxID=400777 RepID=UPI00131573BA|nr:VWA domain-containing protein [Paenibacillus ginsengarvi]